MGPGGSCHGFLPLLCACLCCLRLERAWPNGLLRQPPETRRRRAALQRDQRLLQEAVREKELELAAAKEELEDVKAQFEKAKAEGLAQVHEEAKSISSKLL